MDFSLVYFNFIHKHRKASELQKTLTADLEDRGP